MRRLFLSIFFSVLFCGQAFAAGNIIDRWATDAEATAQTRDDVGLTPANIPSIMAAPGTVSELKLDHTVETLNADRTILITDKTVLWFDCNGSDRNVTLPAMASNSTDLVFTIVNRSDGAGENLVVRDGNATPVTLFTIGPEQGQRFSCDGTDWEAWFDSGIYYDGVNGRIGIGTTNPNEILSVYGTGTNLFSITRSGSFNVSINIANDTDAMYFGINADESFCIGTTIDLNADSKFTVLQNGNIGLGSTISPDTLFELEKESADAEATISVYHATEATAPIITLRKADNNATVPALVDDNAVLGRINFKGHDSTGWHTGAKIEARVDGTPSDGTDMPTELVFSTTADGTGSPTEHLIIAPNGAISVSDYTRTAKIPATSARVGSTAPTATSIINTRGLGFDADAEIAFIAVPIPSDWNGLSDLILKTSFCGTAGDAIADGETVKFDISYNSIAANEAVDSGTEKAATTTYTQSGAGTDKEMIIEDITIDYDNADQPITAGDALFIKFNRDVSTDTYTGAAIVQAWALQYTSNALPK